MRVAPEAPTPRRARGGRDRRAGSSAWALTLPLRSSTRNVHHETADTDPTDVHPWCTQPRRAGPRRPRGAPPRRAGERPRPGDGAMLRLPRGGRDGVRGESSRTRGALRPRELRDVPRRRLRARADGRPGAGAQLQDRRGGAGRRGVHALPRPRDAAQLLEGQRPRGARGLLHRLPLGARRARAAPREGRRALDVLRVPLRRPRRRDEALAPPAARRDARLAVRDDVLLLLPQPARRPLAGARRREVDQRQVLRVSRREEGAHALGALAGSRRPVA